MYNIVSLNIYLHEKKRRYSSYLQNLMFLQTGRDLYSMPLQLKIVMKIAVNTLQLFKFIFIGLCTVLTWIDD